MSIKKISPARIIWDGQDQPRSMEFEDLYFSAENGLEESRYVFLAGNDLEHRWANLEQDSFVICETGFGSGLNLLAAAELWSRTAPKASRLHFVSTELYPMKKTDLEKTLQHWPELSDLAEILIDKYPALTPGFHRFELTPHISVTLIFDEVVNGLSGLCPTLAQELWSYRNWGVDAWFLDGFAPSMNPGMWSEELFALVNRLSYEKTSLATFTCAGMVKRGLRLWGFDIQKKPGFGRKREMLTAFYNRVLETNLHNRKQSYRQTSPCWHLDREPAEKPGSVAIVGAGIAGCTTAAALARRGIKSTIIDSGPCIASGASGNPQAALYARLSPAPGDLEDFCLHALNFARGYYRETLNSAELGDLCGLIQLPRSEKELEKMLRVAERFNQAPELLSFLQSTDLSQKLGINIRNSAANGGLFFPNSGWINGPAFNRHLLELSAADLIANTPVTSVEKQNGQFILATDQQQIGAYDAVILCAAIETLEFQSASWLPVKPIRGQISFLEDQPEARALKTVLCRENYLTPVHQGKQSVGATYELNTYSSDLKQQDHQTNIAELQKLIDTEAALRVDMRTLQGRAGTRTTTPDYLPIVGTLPDLKAFETEYAGWKKDRKRPIPKAHSGHRGLYLNLGYGSRGYVYAPLCAEILSAKIAKEPEPVSFEMQRSLHPARFLVRSLSRNRPVSGYKK